jgi:formylglycine-generating enzyme required for sulfatase activity
MKRSLSILIVFMVTAMLSGCILSKTPKTNDVYIPFGEQMTFTVNVFPSNATYTWTLDGVPQSNTGKSYVYTAVVGNHMLVVKAKQILGTDTQAWNILTNNTPPVANVGPDQTVVPGSNVTLNGSGSTDPENNIVSYQWQQTDGLTVTLTNADKAIAQFRASVVIGSVLTFELTVSDAGGLQSTDTCVVSVSEMSDPITDLLNSMVSIPNGTFQMGSTDDENGWAHYTTPVHAVTLQGFEMGKYEVTQAQYTAIMGTNPSGIQGINYPNTENNPVETVNWYNAMEFCTVLSALTGRTFTLPSEAQWEYACRAGNTTLYSFGDSDALLGDYAWYWGNSDGRTYPVGTKLPNAWGLYDMMGNVAEWCLDSEHENYVGAPTDGSAWEPGIGISRALRGSAWNYVSNVYSRSAFRSFYQANSPGIWLNCIGFRIVEIP